MYRRIILILLGIVFGGAISGFSEVINIRAGLNIFNDPRGGVASYVEFPFSVKRFQFDFTLMEGENWRRGIISADLYLTDTLGHRIDSVSTYFYTRVNTILEAAREDVRIHNKLTLYIDPGVYEAALIVTDVNGGKAGTYYYGRFEIDPLIFDSLCFSDIELAKSILIVNDSAVQMNSRLIKNGYEIIPSPMGIYNKPDDYLYIYAEIYNLQYSPAGNDSLTLTYQILKENGEIYFDYGEMSIYKPGSTAVITNKFDYSSWALGKYELKIIATDLSAGTTTSAQTKFSIVSLPANQPSYVFSQYISPLDTAGLETKTNWIRFIVEPSEWEMFLTLNDTGKYAFINRHFDDRDPSPGTKINEYFLDVLSRFKYANDNFSSLAGIKNGWNTDRGRVMLKYGLNDEIKTVSLPSVLKPLQVWYYYSIQGSVYFIFEDSRGYGNYRLVHSTAKGELFSGGWDELINSYELEFD